LTARALAGNEAEISHELARIVEPPHVANLSDYASGDREGDTAKRLQRHHHGAERPLAHELGNLPIDELFAIDRLAGC
jgi:hypothetical protein